MRIKRTFGNVALLSLPGKTTFLCSQRVPISRFWETFSWVESLDTETDCIVCAVTSYYEKEVLKSLIEQNINAIVVGVSFVELISNLAVRDALNRSRLLLLELSRDAEDMGETVDLRNHFMLTMSDSVVLGYMRPRGHLEKMLGTQPRVSFAIDLLSNKVAEHELTNKRPWSALEDNILLSNYYEGRSIHFLHQTLRRGYASIQMRLNILTLSHEFLEGVSFESYVLSLLHVEDHSGLVVREWRGDKSLPGVCPESNHYPDLVLRQKCHGTYFDYAIECKWRNHLPSSGRWRWCERKNLDYYRKFEKDHGITVFLAFGFGCDSAAPDSLFVVPLDDIPTTLIDSQMLARYQVPVGTLRFVLDENGKVVCRC